MRPFEEIKSDFYIKPTEDTESIEFVDSYTIEDEFRKLVCVPYFTDLHSVRIHRDVGNVLKIR